MYYCVESLSISRRTTKTFKGNGGKHMRFTGSGKNLFQRILFLIVAGLLIFALALMSACGGKPSGDDDDDDDDDDTTTEAEYKPIANNDFTSLYDTSDSQTYNPRVPKDWSFSGDYADSSSKAPDSSGTYTRYGTISVIDDNFEYNRSKYESEAIKDFNAKEENKENQVKLPNPHTMNYNAEYDKDEEDGYYTLDEDGNLKVDGEGDNAVTRDDDKILMIGHLQNTATRYKSSSITVQPNSVMKISVRVLTMYFDAETGTFTKFPVNEKDNNNSFGATLTLSGGVEEAFTITGIDTNKTWKTFTFYIRGDASASKTVYLELGLGSGDPDFREYYAQNAYAFFDNIETEFLQEKDLKGVTAYYSENLDGEADDIVIPNRIKRTADENENWNNTSTAFYDFRFETSRTLGNAFSSINSDPNAAAQIAGSQVEDASWSTSAGDGAADYSSKIQKEFADKPFEQGFYEFHNTKHWDGTTNKLTASNGMKFDLGELQENTYYRVSLWMKTSEFNGKSGANLYLTRPHASIPDAFDAPGQLNNLDTTTNEMSKTDLEKDENAYYQLNSWRLYSFYIKGGNVTTDDLSLEVWFGPKYNKQIDKVTYPDNYQQTLSVLFTAPVVEEISSSYYSSASTAENIATADLSKTNDSSPVTNGEFTNVQTNSADNENEEGKVVKPASWTFIGGLGDNGYDTAPYGSDVLLTGVMNSKNIAAFGLDENELNDIRNFRGNADNSILFMQAKTATAFGYRSSSITVPANSVYFVKIYGRVLSGTPKANIYLTDTDGEIITADLEATKEGEDGKEETVTVNEHGTMELEVSGTEWKEYTFMIRTGEKAKTFTMELWLGSRFLPSEDAEATETYTTGAVAFDFAYYAGSSKETGASLTPDQEESNANIDKLFDITKSYADDESFVPENPDDAEYNLGFSKDSTKFFDYKDLDLEEDEEEETTPPEEETTPAASGLGWVDIATLVLALALIFALGAVAYKQIKSSKFVKKRQLKKAAAKAKNRSYDRKHAKPVTRRSEDGEETGDEDETFDEEEESDGPEIEGSEFDEDLETPEALEAERADQPDEAEEVKLSDDDGEEK